jgi:hypothetical protein
LGIKNALELSRPMAEEQFLNYYLLEEIGGECPERYALEKTL